MTDTASLALLKLMVEAKAQGAKFVHKQDSRFWRFLGWVVRIVTFGGNTQFNTNYTTTIGKTIALPDNWDSWSPLERLSIVTHEMVHIDQIKRYGVFLWALGWVFIPLPLGLAWCRYVLEREAYLEGLKVCREFGQESTLKGRVEGVVWQLSSPAYGWCWPFPNRIRAWFYKKLGLI